MRDRMYKLAGLRHWIVVVVLLVAATAHAQDTDKAKARELWRRGTQHYNLGEFAEALESFKAAYRQSEDPTFLYNLGQCARQLGQRREALQFFQAYLRELPNAPNSDQVRGLIAKLERDLPPEPERPPASAPSPGPVAPSVPAASAAPTASAATAAPDAPSLVSAAPAPRDRRRPLYKRWYVWTALGVVVAAGAGIALALTLDRPHNPTAPTSEGTFMPFTSH